MDVANSLAAQHQDNYSSSLLELPPSIENIYATNDQVSMNHPSRFCSGNQQAAVSNSQMARESQANSARHLKEANVSLSLNQQITGNDVN